MVPYENWGAASAANYLRTFVRRLQIDTKDPAAPLFPLHPDDPTCSIAMS